MLLSMRVLEGLASGILQPIPAIVILRMFGSSEQGRAMGIFGFGVVLAPAVGPSIGGFLVEYFGWRSIFFVDAVELKGPAEAEARRQALQDGVQAGTDNSSNAAIALAEYISDGPPPM